jgi:hypothetical protein
LLWIASTLPFFLVKEVISFLAVLEHEIAPYVAHVEGRLRKQLDYMATLDPEDPWLTWNRDRNVENLTIFLDFYRPNDLHDIYYEGSTLGRREIVVYAKGKVEAQLSKDCRTQVVLGVSMVVFLFCLRSLKVARPKGFEGELLQHDMAMGGGC